MLLKDKVAIVTGGAKGMGRAIALRFAEEGCDVVVTDTDMENALKVADQIAALGRRSLAVIADITDSTYVRKMVDEVLTKFGTIDILVNNAGGVPGTKGTGNSDTITEKEWDRIINLNLKGTFLVTMAVLPTMKKNRSGKIVNISSMGALSPSVSVLHYHAAKAGVLGFSLNLAFELAPLNIHVNAIAPGPVETTFWDALIPDGPQRDAFFGAMVKQEIPLQRMGTARDIAGVALFLSSELSDYMTGQTLCVAGGQPMLSQAAAFDFEGYFKNMAEQTEKQ